MDLESEDLLFSVFGPISGSGILLSFLFTGFLFTELTEAFDFTVLVFLLDPLNILPCSLEDCLVVLVTMGAILRWSSVSVAIS